MASIFEHEDYREYLKHYLKHLPKKGRGELTRMAQHLTVNTTLLSQILAGTRDFNQEQVYELNGYLGHTELEGEYFFYLVQAERAGSKNLKNHFEKKLKSLRQEALKISRRIGSERTFTDEECSVFYSSWLYSAIHLFTSTKKNGVTLEEIVERFHITRTRANEILHFLVRCEICKDDSGLYTMGVQSTFVPQGSPHMLRHHANWRVKAIQKGESILETELMTTVQVSLSQKDFKIIREQFAELLKHVMKTVDDSPAEEIACLNLDWYWLEK
jgi:uncharacterized protein (TIGR02147 family)